MAGNDSIPLSGCLAPGIEGGGSEGRDGLGASLRDRAACRASSLAASWPCSLALRVAGGMAPDRGPSGGIPCAGPRRKGSRDEVEIISDVSPMATLTAWPD